MMIDILGDRDAESGTGRCTYGTFDPRSDDVAAAVLDTLASARDAPSLELAPLSRSIDPDALTALFCGSSTGDRLAHGALVFTHEGYEIAVTSGGDIRVRPTE